uniref:RRM domain-containing protein n=1 Tax=Mucochytrium quahogii TaxID=96639 RepID=A0A7S2RJ62_9STRA|mmetsp:Transcript_24393/g.39579  ORF Transcript_24393/g.39579 Transcript_24393/m.39579 type:complete len:1042 (+) Transcript_24393:441-3566(+)|eukprot:CAMPEP_0203747826 /NCGR_PEP_ID=MMETSP0098-20131031/2872_1 /ASSEMBLY_ACC=CAM_ASM_000208 /TAXON_ID=96639 /ORGANISM=" , Strain NY0313808BC1" /LENGTH=1041 /DNA_ID=CAMNT_0050636387 /DNA_START=376 /DNA_END=3501 /DNA_ORIENTATION=-
MPKASQETVMEGCIVKCSPNNVLGSMLLKGKPSDFVRIRARMPIYLFDCEQGLLVGGFQASSEARVVAAGSGSVNKTVQVAIRVVWKCEPVIFQELKDFKSQRMSLLKDAVCVHLSATETTALENYFTGPICTEGSKPRHLSIVCAEAKDDEIECRACSPTSGWDTDDSGWDAAVSSNVDEHGPAAASSCVPTTPKVLMTAMTVERSNVRTRCQMRPSLKNRRGSLEIVVPEGNSTSYLNSINDSINQFLVNVANAMNVRQPPHNGPNGKKEYDLSMYSGNDANMIWCRVQEVVGKIYGSAIVQIYGSFATGLWLPGQSDVDLLISFQRLSFPRVPSSPMLPMPPMPPGMFPHPFMQQVPRGQFGPTPVPNFPPSPSSNSPLSPSRRMSTRAQSVESGLIGLGYPSVSPSSSENPSRNVSPVSSTGTNDSFQLGNLEQETCEMTEQAAENAQEGDSVKPPPKLEKQNQQQKQQMPNNFGRYFSNFQMPSPPKIETVEIDRDQMLLYLYALHSALKVQPWCKSIKLIKSSTMPVIKMIGVNNAVPGGAGPEVPLDISFRTRGHYGLEARDYVLQLTESLPGVLQPLVLILKQLLREFNLHDVYTGGLGSYSLTTLVWFYLLRCGFQVPTCKETSKQKRSVSVGGHVPPSPTSPQQPYSPPPLSPGGQGIGFGGNRGEKRKVPIVNPVGLPPVLNPNRPQQEELTDIDKELLEKSAKVVEDATKEVRTWLVESYMNGKGGGEGFNLGKLLLGFLHLYSLPSAGGLDLSRIGVSMQNRGEIFRQSKKEQPAALCIQDPVVPTRCIGSGSFNMYKVQQKFAELHAKLMLTPSALFDLLSLESNGEGVASAVSTPTSADTIPRPPSPPIMYPLPSPYHMQGVPSFFPVMPMHSPMTCPVHLVSPAHGFAPPPSFSFSPHDRRYSMTPTGDSSSNFSQHGSARRVPPRQSTAPVLHHQNQQGQLPNAVCVSGIPPKTTWEEYNNLLKNFKSFGHVVGSAPDKEHGTLTVVYTNQEDAKGALAAMQSFTLHEQRLDVKLTKRATSPVY